MHRRPPASGRVLLVRLRRTILLACADRSQSPTGKAGYMPNIAPWAFVLAAPDLHKSAGYFRNVLGFRVLWEEATDRRLVGRGAACTQPFDQQYGMREIIVTTVDSHLIVFGQERR
jgi:hypothetical protein